MKNCNFFLHGAPAHFLQQRFPFPSGVQAFLSLIMVCCLVLCPQILLAKGDQTSVGVCFYEDGDYMSRNRDGEYSGFNFEYLQGIAKFDGLRYNVVDGGSWENCLSMLEKGEIDILPAVFYTRERAQKMFFSEHPMVQMYATLNVRLDDLRFSFEDFASFQGMKVGIINNSQDGEKFRQYCQDKKLKLTIIPYAETSALLAALENKSLDAVAITHLGRNSTFRSVAQYATAPLYIAVTHKRPDVLQRVNQSINSLTLRDPFHTMRLYAKYFSVAPGQKPVFSNNELDFIAQKQIIRVAYNPTWAPLAYTDPDTGIFSGVVADLFEKFKAETGLNFQFIPLSQEQALEKGSRGEVDVVFMLSGDYLWSEHYLLDTTSEYLRSPTMLVRLRQADNINVIALQRGFGLSKKISESNADKKVIYYNSVRECFDALLAGKVDAAYSNAHIFNYLRAEPRYAVLDATPLSNFTEELRIGVSRQADPHLFTILDKSVNYMPTEEMDALVLKNTIRPQRISLQDVLATYTTEIIASMTAISLLIILLLTQSLRAKSRHNAQISSLLYRDRLTGLDNIDKFYIDSTRLLTNAKSAYAILYGDINQFKLINDTLGFAAGDSLLCAYANILRDSLEKNELCARVSADHFILLLHCQSWNKLEARIAAMTQTLDEWRHTQGMPYKIDTIFGVYMVNSSEQHKVHLMLDLANHARRNAKQRMLGLLRYDEKMRQDALSQQELSGSIESALKQGELTAWLQPKVDMFSGMVIGSEALVRWNHPTRGLLMPDSFMPLFERNGTVLQVDMHVFTLACQMLHQWHAQNLPVHPVSCNFSSLHFDRPNFPQQLTDIADRYGVPHCLLEVEITESSFMASPDVACAQILELKERGFLIAVDDFGSGYSSLSQVQQIMANVLKLDRSFVQRNTLGTRERIVLGSVIRLGTELGMSIICEGVETIAQAEVLMQAGCRCAQGYYYARPMPRHDFEYLLREKALLPLTNSSLVEVKLLP